MRHLRLLSHALAFAVMLVAATSRAQTATITGTVTDSTGAPVSGAEVRVDGTNLHTLTDDDGHFELRDVPPGPQVVRALMLGFKPLLRPVTAAPGARAKVNLRLSGHVIDLAPVEVVVGSRARHTAADELAVPVDVFNHELLLRQGTTETSQMLQALSPSVNFPRQTVTDANDIVRPFTLRGLSPDHTLVLVNGLRRHQSAVVNTFAYGTGAGSSGVDLNAIPSSAIDRVEVLRDGASAQYGSDAIAGVVNVVMRRGRFAPFATVSRGRYYSGDFPADGDNLDVSAGWGVPLAQGSLTLAAQYLDRQPTNRAWADGTDTSVTGLPDVVGPDGDVVEKRNPVPQPNHHWGDGLERDFLSIASAYLPLSARSQIYAFGGYSNRLGSGNGYRRRADSDRNWNQIYPLGFLPEFRPNVTDYSVAGGWMGEARGWNLSAGGSFGHNGFIYDLRHTLNASLGPSLTEPTAPGPDGILGTADDPGIPNQTSFYAGEVHRDEFVAEVGGDRPLDLGLREPVNLAVGASWRRERWVILPGEKASWINGYHPNQNGGIAAVGSQVFGGIQPGDFSDSRRENVGVYAELESKVHPLVLANAAARFEHYTDFGSLTTGKLAARWQPSPRLTFRAAASTGFRAPGLSQIHFSNVVTNFIGGEPKEIGIFPVDRPAARLLGAKPLKEEKSVNASAGLAATPFDDLTLTLDTYEIWIHDRILLGATFDDSTTLRILDNAGLAGVAGVQYFTNGLDTRTRGVDLTADLRLRLPRMQALNVRAALNWGRNQITRVDGLPAELATSTEEEGLLDETTRVSIEKERPDWRGTLSAEYTRSVWRALVRASYYGKFSSTKPSSSEGSTETYPPRTLADLELGWQVRQVDWAFGVTNVFDTYPGQAKLTANNNDGIFPWAAASPFGFNGRFFYTRATWTLPG